MFSSSIFNVKRSWSLFPRGASWVILSIIPSSFVNIRSNTFDLSFCLCLVGSVTCCIKNTVPGDF